MNTNKLTYPKRMLTKVLLAVTLVFSFFVGTAPVGLSSVQPQKTATELLGPAGQSVVSRTIAYSNKTVSASPQKNRTILTSGELKATIACNNLISIKLAHLDRQYTTIKPTLQFRLPSHHFPHSDNQPLVG